ncbi:MAG: hypothetical protein ACRER3_08320 [Pseudomonas fluorescens]
MKNTRFTDHQRSEVQRRILDEASASGGMITAVQLRELLNDIPAGERAQAVVALQQQGQLETTGTGAAAIHALIRLNTSSPVALLEPANSAVGRPRQDDPLALRNRLKAISQDLDEALVDACCIELPHAAIQNLLTANRATRAAASSLSD